VTSLRGRKEALTCTGAASRLYYFVLSSLILSYAEQDNKQLRNDISIVAIKA